MDAHTSRTAPLATPVPSDRDRARRRRLGAADPGVRASCIPGGVVARPGYFVRDCPEDWCVSGIRRRLRRLRRARSTRPTTRAPPRVTAGNLLTRPTNAWSNGRMSSDAAGVTAASSGAAWSAGRCGSALGSGVGPPDLIGRALRRAKEAGAPDGQLCDEPRREGDRWMPRACRPVGRAAERQLAAGGSRTG